VQFNQSLPHLDDSAATDISAVSSLRRPGPLGLIFTIPVAIIGGIFGIVGAIAGELQPGSILFVPLIPILAAPIIEEALKPVGVYLLQVRWPRLLLGRLHTGILGGLGGLTFGVIESLAYVWGADDPSGTFVAYRFTLPLILHATCSFLVGLGIVSSVVSWANGENPLPKSSRNLYIAAVAIHATFNTLAITLTITGVVDLD